MTLIYAAFIGISAVTLFHVPETSGAAQGQRALRAEAAAWDAFLLALPWILVFSPNSGHLWLYFAALLLNIATVYGISAWLIPPPRRRAGKRR